MERSKRGYTDLWNDRNSVPTARQGFNGDVLALA